MTIQNMTFSWQQVVSALLKEHNVTSGLWTAGVSLRFAALNSGPSEEQMMPSGLVGVESIVLSPATQPGPLVFDAAEFGARPVSKKAAVRVGVPVPKNSAAPVAPSAPKKAVARKARAPATST